MAELHPKTGKDFVQLAQKSDKVHSIREGKGSHVVIEFVGGTSVSVPVHGNKQLGKGILNQLLKTFRAAGVLLYLATIPPL
jgi:threonine dehydrogenase-like Zn-dependent dehydrogenase